MASKLFHAVVAVGMSLGSVACGGRVDRAAPADLPPDDAGAPPVDADLPLHDAGVHPDASIAPDAAPADAGATDAPKDVILEAFCDATWPITKSGREVCGPYDACATLDAPWCYGPDGAGGCKLYPLECVGAEWHCMGGATPAGNIQPPEPCE